MYFAPAYNPWNRLLRELNTLSANSSARNSAYPKVNAYSNEDGVVLTAELPGVDPAGLSITVQENLVTIAGSLPERVRKDGETYHRRERVGGAFSREFRLPFRIDSDAVQAELRHGILTLKLARHSADRPKAIEVKVA